MSNKFEEALDESLQAAQTYEQAVQDIEVLVQAMDQAVAAKTNGQVRVIKRVFLADTLLKGLDRRSNQAEAEDLPPGLIRIVARVQGAPEQQREVCSIRPSRAGYPVELLSFANTRTSCPDVESLEYKLADIIRDARFGLKLKTLMNEARAASASGISAASDGDTE